MNDEARAALDNSKIAEKEAHDAGPQIFRDFWLDSAQTNAIQSIAITLLDIRDELRKVNEREAAAKSQGGQ